VPNLRLGGAQDAIEQVILPSGKGLNVARAAHVLGCDVMATGLLAGSCGRWIERLVEQAGIAHRFYSLPAGESRTSTILVDPTQHQTTVVHDLGPTVPSALWPTLRAYLVSAVIGYPWVALCGSCPDGLPKACYRDLCSDLQAQGHVVGIDARDHWLAAAIDTQPTLVKCNHHEAARVLGCTIDTPVEAVRAAQTWIERGIRYVVISLGAQGATAIQAGDAWQITAADVEVLSAIGSGDAMMAGLMLQLAQGASLADATRYGVAVGTANALTLGSACLQPESIPVLVAQSTISPVPY
jgi:1-phosphofructokinase family hexose kinase